MRGSLVRRITAVAATVAVVISVAPAVAQAAPVKPKVDGFYKVGYFTQWGIYGRNFQLAKVQNSGAAARLTHINYAFGNVNEAGVCASADAWADWQTAFSAELSVDGVADTAEDPLRGNFNQILELKKKNPKLRVLISLGGWTLSKWFSDAALTPESREKLVTSCVDLFLKGNLPDLAPGIAKDVFDGIDIDWEWPNSPGNPGNIIRPEDKANFTALIREFRRQLTEYGRERDKYYDLTAFAPASPKFIDDGWDIPNLMKDFDFITVQGYDFHGSWDRKNNQQSAIKVPPGAPDNPDFSVEVAINKYLSLGAKRQQLVLGVPYYSQGWTGTKPNTTNGLFAENTAAAKGTFADGSEDYKVLKNLPGKNNFKVYRDFANGHAWLYDGNTFWTYDDPAQMFQKAFYVRNKGLGGVMAWSLDGDDEKASLTKSLSVGLGG